MKSIFKISLTLAIICAIAAAALAAVNQMTQKAIAINSQKELTESLKIIYPQAERFEQIGITGTTPESPTENKEFTLLDLYQAFQRNETIGYVFKVESRGYGGQIVFLIAVSTQNNTMIGMKVLEHQETPGLGSEITSPHFQNQFKGKSLSDRFEINQDIQAISGATISSRAVIRACQGVVTYLEKERGQ